MKRKAVIVFLYLLAFSGVFAQSNFDLKSYSDRLSTNTDLTFSGISAIYPTALYYEDREVPADPDYHLYFGEISTKYGITAGELELLKKNKFVVTERLSYPTMAQALDDIFHNDLPLFLSTDIILNTLHISYDNILMDLEAGQLEPDIKEVLSLMRGSFSDIAEKYKDVPGLSDPLKDVDLYLTIALSLADSTTYDAMLTDPATVDTFLNAIYSESVVSLPLFTGPEHLRELDFSQFKPRGHYNTPLDWYQSKTLSKYFRTMMWLGRMDFWLTPPDSDLWTKEEIRRMHLGAYILNELLHASGADDILAVNDNIITFMVGESDNLTPSEYDGILAEFIPGTDAALLLNDEIYDPYYNAVASSLVAQQKILSCILYSDPMDPKPMELPVSFRLMGQRFTIDSYVFSNVVFDRITYGGSKVFRGLPYPLDAMFVLGNDNALPLLQDELETYKYSQNLDALRYLADSYDSSFWQASMYNTWLQSMRELNPVDEQTGTPYFMKTVAWQQQKLNTQLASWAQLRHDNLLYVKQSYTGVMCSFPHTFVEPYPEFYNTIAEYCELASSYFSGLSELIYHISSYFNKVKFIMQKLSVIAEKELKKEILNDDEILFLKQMLRESTEECGDPPVMGWIADLYYNSQKLLEKDYVIADVHTQPADEMGNLVGKILHVGTGRIDLGIFLANSPSSDYAPMAFIGPFMSYYDTVTEKFFRMTDELWTSVIQNGKVPDRPSWTNVYLAGKNGEIMSGGDRIKGILFTGIEKNIAGSNNKIEVYPNPASQRVNFRIQANSDEILEIRIYDIQGRQVDIIEKDELQQGVNEVNWNPRGLEAGVYLAVIKTKTGSQSYKIILE
jgi:Protein of unknown function (DUF3160)/Secretion system C-terminal sorting domain